MKDDVEPTYLTWPITKLKTRDMDRVQLLLLPKDQFDLDFENDTYLAIRVKY